MKELEMIKLESEKKIMDINKYEDEIMEMQGKFDECNSKLQPLREELKKAIEIGERLSTITASITKAETE